MKIPRQHIREPHLDVASKIDDFNCRTTCRARRPVGRFTAGPQDVSARFSRVENALSSAISSARSENAFVSGVCAARASELADVKAEVQRRRRKQADQGSVRGWPRGEEGKKRNRESARGTAERKGRESLGAGMRGR